MDKPDDLQKNNYVYYAQVFKPPIGEYNVVELKVHNINAEKQYFTGCEVNKSRQTFIFNFSDWNKIVFADRNQALDMVKTAEKEFGKVINKENAMEGISRYGKTK